MTFVDPENYRQASTFIHVFQGAALAVLGAAEALSADNRLKKLKLLPPAAFILGGTLMLSVMLYFLGGWKPAQLRDALEVKGGFYIFIAFAWFFTAAGLSRLMAVYLGEKGRAWQAIFIAFLFVMGLLYFRVSAGVNETARLPVSLAHAAIGAFLLAAVLAKALYFYLKKRAFQGAWAVLLLITAGQLLIYRESPDSFSFSAMTIRTSPGPGAPALETPANAKPADKKRPADRSRL